jgi:8-oxo-dGTP pyrophosphatase MutT (NUDIX family)
VLLVTSRYTGQWIVPKGTIDPGEEPARTAARETEEEAGVRGRISGRLGAFDYPRGHQTGRVETFVLEVTEELDSWPEQSQRRRRWFSLQQALEQVQRPEVLAMLRCIAGTAGDPPADAPDGPQTPEK